ncbi:polysaccharide deacetylase family protein [Stappia sp.]|uniref:polysaccharide deacetylase family protein n=1 Tax=Stappia sp. TaxID=1870903 RepID=UPI0032D9690B
MTPLQTVIPRTGLFGRAKRRIKTLGLRGLRATGASALIGRIYGGRGVILMFHDFTRDPHANLDQGCHIEDLDRILDRLRRRGRDIVTLDEAMARLADPRARPFAVLTFDDGYRSNRDLALPVLERHEAPATIYVPTGAVTRTLNAWWLGLRQLFLDYDTVDIAPMGLRFLCPDFDSKIAGLRRATAWVWEDFRREEQLRDTFSAHGISLPDLVDRHLIGEAGMIELDRHPLIEIGAHTTTHRALARLAPDEVRRDIADNKAWLEEKLGREVPHFAYPYGAPSISGTREAEIVRGLGFRTGVTTTEGCLFPNHLSTPFLLPRQNAEYTEDGAAYAACGIDGVFRALATRGGNPVAVGAGAGA